MKLRLTVTVSPTPFDSQDEGQAHHRHKDVFKVPTRVVTSTLVTFAPDCVALRYGNDLRDISSLTLSLARSSGAAHVLPGAILLAKVLDDDVGRPVESAVHLPGREGVA